MQLTLVKRGRCPAGIETIYRTDAPLEANLEQVRATAKKLLKPALGLERGPYASTNEEWFLLADMSNGVYVVDIIEPQKEQIRALPLTIESSDWSI